MDADFRSVWDLVLPVLNWAAVILVCVILGVWLSGVIRRIAEEDVPGRVACPRCGYDVRVTPGRCPECGLELPPELHMPIYTIPEGSGPFIVVESKDGQFAVAEEWSLGQPRPDLLFIPCRDQAQAADIADRLNRGEHDGTIQVDLLPPGMSFPTAEADEGDGKDQPGRPAPLPADQPEPGTQGPLPREPR